MGRLSEEEGAFVANLKDQHREADHLYAELKSIARELHGGPPECELQERYRAAAERLTELYRFHIVAEDQTLIAICQRVLQVPELAEISAEMKRRRGLPT